MSTSSSTGTRTALCRSGSRCTPIEVLNAGFEEGLDQQKSTGRDDADYVLSGEHKPGMPLYRRERPS